MHLLHFDESHWIRLAIVTGIGIATLSTYGACRLFRKKNELAESAKNRKNLREKREDELKSLRRSLISGPPPTNVDDITNLSFSEVSSQLQSRRLRYAEVLRAYQQKALDVHDRTNCLTHVVQEATEISIQLAEQPHSSPLHGIPISVKDSITMKDYPNTWGCVRRADLPIHMDAVFLTILRRQGAVPFVRTNIPQLVMSHESSNPIYGCVTNRHHPSRGPGGSSGGEGALIAGGGSLIGLGSDIAGSIRSPAAFSGICGLKPGVARVSNITASPPWSQAIVLPTIGPMARDVDSLVAVMRCLLVPDLYELDPFIPPVPFRQSVFDSKKPLRIGHYVDDGYHAAGPASKRAVSLAKEALERAGHTLVPWQPPHAEKAVFYLFQSLRGGKEAGIPPILYRDEIDQCMSFYLSATSMHPLVRWFRCMFLRLTGKPKFARFLESTAGLASVSDWWQLTTDVEIYRREVVQSWKQNGLDAVICPASVTAASKLGSAGELLRAGSYFYLFNVLDIPAGVVPVSHVSADDILGLADYGADDELGEWVKADQEDTEGLPVGVQVAALRWQEETCLRVMKEIETGVNYTRPAW